MQPRPLGPARASVASALTCECRAVPRASGLEAVPPALQFGHDHEHPQGLCPPLVARNLPETCGRSSTFNNRSGRGPWLQMFPRKPSEVLAKLMQGSTTPRRTPWQSPSLRCIFAPCRFRVGLGNILTDVHKLAGICSCAHDIHWSEVSLCPVPCNAR